jgi:Arc/MetJ-type ribon-helix-helix transcriptional regulator
MTEDLKIVSVKLPERHLRRIRGNRSEFIREAVAEKLGRQSSPDWQPKTATGRKLLALRKRFVAQGGELLNSDGIAEELRQRRGGLT